VTHQPRPNPDTTPAAVSLARVAAALTAWDTGRSPAVTGEGVAGGTDDGSGGADDGYSPVPAGRDATAPARAGEIQPGGAPT
jgi:hypothetical protein